MMNCFSVYTVSNAIYNISIDLKQKIIHTYIRVCIYLNAHIENLFKWMWYVVFVCILNIYFCHFIFNFLLH